jgi:hypothetical protein
MSSHRTAKVILDLSVRTRRYLKTGPCRRPSIATLRLFKIKGGPTMVRTRHCLVFAGLAIALGSASGCASDGTGLGSSHSRRSDATNVVQRPTYEVEGTKPLYLGGYAGANYRAPAQAGP